MSFQFRPFLTIAVVPMLATLLGLGIWQIQRLEWKETLLSEIDSRISGPAAPLTVNSIDVPEYQPVNVTGRFLIDKTIFLTGRSHGGRSGVKVLTPFQLANGPALWVDRGWSPDEKHSFIQAVPGEDTEIKALLRFYKPQKGLFVGGNDADAGLWFLMDPVAMSQSQGLPSNDERYLFLLEPLNDKSVPVILPVTSAIRNSHFQYALIWFSLAISLAVIYVLMSLNRRDGPTS